KAAAAQTPQLPEPPQPSKLVAQTVAAAAPATSTVQHASAPAVSAASRAAEPVAKAVAAVVESAPPPPSAPKPQQVVEPVVEPVVEVAAPVTAPAPRTHTARVADRHFDPTPVATAPASIAVAVTTDLVEPPRTPVEDRPVVSEWIPIIIDTAPSEAA